MASKIFVLIPHAGGEVDGSALELLGAAQALFPGAPATALVLGAGPGVATAARALAGFEEVWSFDQACLAYPNAELIRALLVKVLPAGAVVLLAHSTLGMDLGPGLSVKLGAAYLPDVVGAGGGGDAAWLGVVRQEYAGQVSAHVQGRIQEGAVITVRSGAFPPAAGAGAGTVLDKSPEAEGLSARRRFREVVAAEPGDVDITREDVLVSVGRGIGEQENLELVQDLAGALGAAVSCSRPIVDAKWLDKSRQVGTSGQTVKPKVYLALGISGSFQHLGGIKGSPFIIAVNKSPKAPVFQVANVGVVADLLELLPELTEQIKNA